MLKIVKFACAAIAAGVFVCSPVHDTKGQTPESPQPLTVAFIGDQGRSHSTWSVLQLIKAEGADLVLHQGDLDYRDEPIRWDHHRRGRPRRHPLLIFYQCVTPIMSDSVGGSTRARRVRFDTQSHQA